MDLVNKKDEKRNKEEEGEQPYVEIPHGPPPSFSLMRLLL